MKTLDERIAEVSCLRTGGRSYQEIALHLGVNRRMLMRAFRGWFPATDIALPTDGDHLYWHLGNFIKCSGDPEARAAWPLTAREHRVLHHYLQMVVAGAGARVESRREETIMKGGRACV